MAATQRTRLTETRAQWYGIMDRTTDRTANDDSSSLPPAAVKEKPIDRLVVQLQGHVDPKACDWVSVFACLLTGYTSAISFTACYVW